ncbi:MAG: D-alanyl-D-alanine carboxypeptidase [Treponema sp.]|nr:D-alanyl-D-alanine carboxypeptidase [Treponema sp.]MBR7079890.1 D-alanyl-D-alanine carboxypeptidase [Treponema sp.]
MKKNKTKHILLIILIVLVVLAAFSAVIFTGAKKAVHPDATALLSEQEKKELSLYLDSLYPDRTSIEIKPLPYSVGFDEPSLKCGSAILIDTRTGSILFEKNADEEIPPASMTKLVEMFVVYQAVSNGEVSLDDEVPLPPESWARNLPSDASRMYLDEGQHVTLRELLLGLAIASGNDASIAVANYVCSDMDEFVARMNKVISDMGLTKTHFVESSGYSELNLTTAREFATFSRQYINKYPETLELYHSQPSITYPQRKNLPDNLQNTPSYNSVKQMNTNRLLDTIQGCDGLKTGFIYESGYNIAVTAEQNGTRFLSVTMQGPGSSTAEGNKYRVQDNKALFNYAFSNFADYTSDMAEKEHEFTVGVLGGDKNTVRLVPLYDESLTVPFLFGNSPTESASAVKAWATVPDVLYGEVGRGQVYGTLKYTLNGKTLREIPLVADRDVQKGNVLKRFFGSIEYKLITKFLKKNNTES